MHSVHSDWLVGCFAIARLGCGFLPNQALPLHSVCYFISRLLRDKAQPPRGIPFYRYNAFTNSAWKLDCAQ
jgi:hypothetical protein